MSVPQVQIQAIEKVLMVGDLSQLSSEQRVSYYKSVCESLGLNPLTKPFEFITLNGKLVMYARRECTEQLRKLHNVSIKIVAREVISGVYVVTAQARFPDGREDESTGAVNIENLKGESLANAYLKSETKAKRRVTLSICGLGLLDETEVESITKETKPRLEEIKARHSEPSEHEIRDARIDKMKRFFSPKGVSSKMICDRFKASEIDDLSSEQIEELAKIAKTMSTEKVGWDHFLVSAGPEYEDFT